METITHALNKNTSKNLQCVNCGNEIRDSSIHDLFLHHSRGAFYLQNHVSDFFENQKHVLCEIKTL
jgi:hypothetical protein